MNGKKLLLYARTVAGMKPSQICHRLRKMARRPCSLGVQPAPMPGRDRVAAPAAVAELDFDPAFLSRFPVEDIMGGTLTFLHETEPFHWHEKWDFPDRSALWNFNLHYCEFLLPLVHAFRETREPRYLDQFKDCVGGWVEQNPRSAGGTGWAAYPVALRLTNWLSCYAWLEPELKADPDFLQTFLSSVYEQYCHLANHLEKDLLANHYFEDLKALLLCALFFRDEGMKKAALGEFKAQCREQILPDGMHFELSPMYHNIILEDVLRVAAALRQAGTPDPEVEGYLPAMLDAAFSLEEGLERVPLFNDGGDNVAKSLSALLSAAQRLFGLAPTFRAGLPESGYYIFRQGPWKLIVDAGQPGPRYNPGHAHCDAMSYELFRDGKPVLVNCGTYAYQCRERSFFRSTAAHNTVMVEGTEQSEVWGAFRMGNGAQVWVLSLEKNGLSMEMTDQKGHRIRRTLVLGADSLSVEDRSDGSNLCSYVHLRREAKVDTPCTQSWGSYAYAWEYGKKETISGVELRGSGKLTYTVMLDA